MGWALENMDASAREAAARELIRVEKVYGTKLHGFCPVHGDQKTASAFYNWDLDSGGCQSCGEKWDLVRLWCLVKGYDGQDIKAFREEFDDSYTGGARHLRTPRPKKETPPPPPPAPEVFVDEADLAALPPLPAEAIATLTEKRGWTPAVMAELDLREFTDSKKQKRIALPIRNDEGQLVNIRLYMPGATEYKIISWFDRLCKACGGHFKIAKGKPKVCKECGASPNDYGRTRLYPSPSAWKKGTIWLCEGEPDTVCALSSGLNAVTQTAGCGTWTEEFTSHFEGRDVVIAYDADGAGYKGALKTAESLIKIAKSVRVIIWPELMGGQDGQ